MLEICYNLFHALEVEGVKYCHWKSNSHLDKAINGKTDLDLLVSQVDKNTFFSVIDSFDVIEIISPPYKRFPDVVDYLGFDHDTGKFIHLHIHFKLILGQKYIKNHHLPLEDIIFDNLIREKNIFIPCPEMELILLIIRAHMKVDAVSLVKHGIKGFTNDNYTAFPRDIEQELHGLIDKINEVKLTSLINQCHLPIDELLITDFISKYSCGKISALDIVKTKRTILRNFVKYKRSDSVRIVFIYVYMELMELLTRLNVIKQRGKTLPYSGKIISVVGADGSGKSTLIGKLEKWLSWKLKVNKYYYGIPKTYLIKFVALIIRALNKVQMDNMADKVESLLWYHVARKRKKISELSKKDRSKGMMVITDRFPLKEFQGMREPMDGPRINKCIRNPVGFFSKVENNCYDNIEYPDRIIVLQVSIDELRKRKDDLDINTHKIKSLAVNSIKENHVKILIDANRTYEEVEIDVKREIWTVMSN